MKEHQSSDSNERRRKRPRLGGKGLSLEVFVKAKSKRTDYNPAIIKKQREFYKNAKCVSKYKKTLKQLDESQSHSSPAAMLLESGADGHEIGNSRKVKKDKKKYSLQNLREEYEKKKEAQEKARLERESIIQAKKEEKKRAESRRKALREKMFKKTRSGQPIMKYRIEHILEGLQDSKN